MQFLVWVLWKKIEKWTFSYFKTPQFFNVKIRAKCTSYIWSNTVRACVQEYTKCLPSKIVHFWRSSSPTLCHFILHLHKVFSFCNNSWGPLYLYNISHSISNTFHTKMFKDFFTGNIKIAHLSKHHIMNTHVHVHKVPHIMLGTGWYYMSRCMYWLLYSWERIPDTHWLEGLFEINNLRDL
jgi:hypothetical protein